MKKSKKFRVAREGATSDGRKISREWLEQMAKNYDPKVYGARVNLEHFKGVYPDSAFRAYGDVLSLATETIDGVMHLVAEISPTDDLVEMNKKRQKVYTSIEVNPAFADTGEAYLVGLAVTDNPASLGTEMLEFSSKAASNPLAARKLHKDNLFTECVEVALEFTEVNEGPSLLDSIKAIFKTQSEKSDKGIDGLREEFSQAMTLLATELSNKPAPVADEKFQTLTEQLAALTEQFTTLKDALDSTDGREQHRSRATGQDFAQTDC